jgi:hypothetical protein
MKLIASVEVPTAGPSTPIGAKHAPICAQDDKFNYGTNL